MAAALQHWELDKQRESHGQTHSCMFPGDALSFLHSPPIPMARGGQWWQWQSKRRLVFVQGLGRGCLTDHSSCGLVALEMKTMAELSPAATITGLACLLCICGLISGARHPCAMLEMSEGMLYLLCSSSTSCLSLVLPRAPRGRGLCLPHQVPPGAGVVAEGKIPRYPRMSGYCPRAQGGVEMLFLL